MSECHTVRVHIWMPDELIRQVRDRTGRKGVSHYVTSAVAERLRHDLLGDLISELEAEHGPVPKWVRAQTGRLWSSDESD